MAVVETLAGIQGGPNTEIETFGGNVRVAPDGTRVDSLQLMVPAIGELTGDGTVSSAKDLDFKIYAKVHTSGMAAALSKETIPITVTGTAANPVFRPDVKAVATEKAKTYGTKAATSLLKGLLGGKK
jgi:hypothetical protein